MATIVFVCVGPSPNSSALTPALAPTTTTTRLGLSNHFLDLLVSSCLDHQFLSITDLASLLSLEGRNDGMVLHLNQTSGGHIKTVGSQNQDYHLSNMCLYLPTYGWMSVWMDVCWSSLHGAWRRFQQQRA